eukprot:11658597-Alexandrium_andersonii.AAC.1
MGVSDFSPIPSRGEGRLAHSACWDRTPSGWILGPELTSTRGLTDCAGAPTYDLCRLQIA